MKTFVVRSYAKINLCLDITGKREDGYHLLDMVMLPLELHDSLVISETPRAVDNYITLDDFTMGDSDNTVTKAIELLDKAHPLNTKFKIENPLPLWRLGEHGKPYLTTHEGILFNISHCREAIVTAVSDHEIGVDAEGRRKFSETLLHRALNDEEQASVLAAPDPELEFARIWTRKEAWFKYTGTGILPDHLKTTEAEVKEAGCSIETIWTDDRFWLSLCQKL